MNWQSFLNGAARVLDLFGTVSEPVDLPATDEEALRRDIQAIAGDWRAIAGDWRAIAGDWQAVAEDMNDAIGHQ